MIPIKAIGRFQSGSLAIPCTDISSSKLDRLLPLELGSIMVFAPITLFLKGRKDLAHDEGKQDGCGDRVYLPS